MPEPIASDPIDSAPLPAAATPPTPAAPARPERIAVAVVEDLPELRRSLVERLRLSGRVEVVLAVASAEALLGALPKLAPAPRIVLMDLGLPGMSGIEATARIVAGHPGVDVLVLTVMEDEAPIFAAVQAGAVGYLLKDTPTARLLDALDDLVAGGVPLSPVVARKLLRMAAAAPPARAASAVVLTDRERGVLRLVVDGMTEARIGAELGISPHTVRTHLVHVYEKLHVRSRAAAVREAVGQGLV